LATSPNPGHSKRSPSIPFHLDIRKAVGPGSRFHLDPGPREATPRHRSGALWAGLCPTNPASLLGEALPLCEARGRTPLCGCPALQS
jgi:hypothetical protein